MRQTQTTNLTTAEAVGNVLNRGHVYAGVSLHSLDDDIDVVSH